MIINQYVNSLSLQNLRKVGRDYNFRCVICGDSKKSKYKTRGWILTNNKGTVYHCHNCGYSKPFHEFLKEEYPSVYEEYLLEWIQEQRTLNPNHTPIKQVEKKLEPVVDVEELKEFKKLIELPKNHKAIQYFIERKFPKKWLSYLYYTDNYAKWVNGKFPEVFKKFPKYDPRIVIPHRNEFHKIVLTQGRSIGTSNLRYITTKVDPNAKKIFGLDLVDRTKKIFIHEGAFDSFFLPNALAMSGADISLDYVKSLAPVDNLIWVFDLEPRNKEICDRIQKVVSAGFPIVLFPYEIKDRYGKDINKMIINGMSKKMLYKMIKDGKCQGLEAEIKFKLWRRN